MENDCHNFRIEVGAGKRKKKGNSVTKSVCELSIFHGERHLCQKLDIVSLPIIY